MLCVACCALNAVWCDAGLPQRPHMDSKLPRTEHNTWHTWGILIMCRWHVFSWSSVGKGEMRVGSSTLCANRDVCHMLCWKATTAGMEATSATRTAPGFGPHLCRDWPHLHRDLCNIHAGTVGCGRAGHWPKYAGISAEANT
jgi:hypothetical protein